MLTNPVEPLLGRADATVTDIFAARAKRSHNRTFLEWQGRRWSYAAAWQEALKFARWAIDRAGPKHGGWRIASYLSNRPEAVWTWLGALAAGAVYVPLNRSHRGEILEDMLKRSGACLLVTDADGARELPCLGKCGIEAVLIVDGPVRAPGESTASSDWSDAVACQPIEPRQRRATDVASIMYTSGTTGRSKAVVLSHNQLCRGAGWVAWSLELTEEDALHAWLPLFHIGGQLDSLLAIAISGGKVALFPTFSRSRFWAQVDASQATIFVGFSNVVELIASIPPRPDDSTHSLRAGIMGGIPPRLHRTFERRFGVRLSESYGMTEAEPLVLPPPGCEYPVGSCGLPSPDFDIAILGEDDEELPVRVVGEIAARPRHRAVLTYGYEGDASATVAAFRNLWFHTGDLGWKDELGFVYFVDRTNHAIRRRGENISSWELENILQNYPGIAECAAVGVRSPIGEDDVKVVISAERGATVDPGLLREWCAHQMAAFMVPRYIQIVEELPRDQMGKVTKAVLRTIDHATWDAQSSTRCAPTSGAGWTL